MLKPLSASIRDVIRQAQTADGLHIGLEPFDSEIRGVRPAELLVIIGSPHSGKTLVELNMLRHNRNKHILLFMPDEPAPLLLMKLAAVHNNIDPVIFEHRLADGDHDAIGMLQQTAEEEFPFLIHVDWPCDQQEMVAAHHEASDLWGVKPDAVFIDYLELMPVGDTVPKQLNFLKSFAGEHNVATVIVHQTSRSSGANGKTLTISSGSYGGEAHATFLLGVRRKKFSLLAELAELDAPTQKQWVRDREQRIAEIEHLLTIHDNTLTVNLTKNKRPGGRLVAETDYLIEPTGRIHPANPPRRQQPTSIQFDNF